MLCQHFLGQIGAPNQSVLLDDVENGHEHDAPMVNVPSANDQIQEQKTNKASASDDAGNDNKHYNCTEVVQARDDKVKLALMEHA